MLANDFNLDGNLDLLLTGNFYAPEVETGRQDAGRGLLLYGDGQGGFAPQDAELTNFVTEHDARSMALLYDGIYPLVLVGNNNDKLEAFIYSKATGVGDHFQAGELYAEPHGTDGSIQRIERYHGSGYLSASSGFIQVGPKTDKVIFYHRDGSTRLLK